MSTSPCNKSFSRAARGQHPTCVTPECPASPATARRRRALTLAKALWPGVASKHQATNAKPHDRPPGRHKPKQSSRPSPARTAASSWLADRYCTQCWPTQRDHAQTTATAVATSALADPDKQPTKEPPSPCGVITPHPRHWSGLEETQGLNLT